jgi:hypothetical protein
MVSKLFFYQYLANSSLLVAEKIKCQIVTKQRLNTYKIDKMLKIVINRAFMNNPVKNISAKKKELKRV